MYAERNAIQSTMNPAYVCKRRKQFYPKNEVQYIIGGVKYTKTPSYSTSNFPRCSKKNPEQQYNNIKWAEQPSPSIIILPSFLRPGILFPASFPRSLTGQGGGGAPFWICLQQRRVCNTNTKRDRGKQTGSANLEWNEQCPGEFTGF